MPPLTVCDRTGDLPARAGRDLRECVSASQATASESPVGKETPRLDKKTVQGQITGFWDEVASTYDSPDNVALPATADYASWVSALHSVLPDRSARVLDVGTGTGFVARIASELGHQVTAIDLSAAMLKASAVRDSQLDITFAVDDAVEPAFSAGSFDVIVSRSLLWTLREPERAFRNWYELLSPGGRVIAIYGLSAAPRSAAPSDADDPTPSRVCLIVTTPPRRGPRCRPCTCLITSRCYRPRPRLAFAISAPPR